MKKNRGFTLIELLATIIILAAIALVAFPILLNTIKNSENQIDDATRKLVENAAKLYVDENLNEYPKKEGNVYCVPFNDLIKNGHLEKGILDSANVDSANKVVKITVTDGYGYEIVNNGECTPKKIEKLVDYIKNIYNPTTTVENGGANFKITYNVDTVNSLIDDGLGGTVSNGGNIRYYGLNPENYIDIGDRDINGDIILWRIIGLFRDIEVVNGDGSTVKQDLVKIVRNESIGAYSWDNKSSGIGSSTSEFGSNNWADARLMMLLNPNYETPGTIYGYEGSLYWNSKSGTCYVGSDNGTTPCDFTSSGISGNAKEKIEKVVWNLGGFGYGSSNIRASYSNSWYLNERREDRYDESYPTTWQGEVGLIYPSDHGYATDFRLCASIAGGHDYNAVCSQSNWIDKISGSVNNKKWTLTAASNTAHSVIWVATKSASDYTATSSLYVNPTLFLKNSVMVNKGNGTVNDPYVIQ